MRRQLNLSGKLMLLAALLPLVSGTGVAQTDTFSKKMAESGSQNVSRTTSHHPPEVQSPARHASGERAGASGVKAAHYRYRGVVAENDLTATPGAVRTTDKEAICSTSTKTLRKVKHSDHVKTFTMYGVKCGAQCGQLYEVDHLISLEIGGTNDLANLWPQPYAPPGAKQKDVLENKLHRMICDGTMTAVEAQQLIVQDWYGAYKKYVKQPDVKLGR